LKAKLENIKASDKTELVDGLSQAMARLDEFCTKIKNAFEPLEADRLRKIKEAIEAVKKFEELARAEGLESLGKYDIDEIGSDAWRGFVRATRAYATAVEKGRTGEIYPSDNDNCLLCLQPLGDQIELIHAYWELLKSSAEAELNKAKADLKTIRRDLYGLPELLFDNSVQVFETVTNFDPKLAEKWEAVMKLYVGARDAAIQAVNELDPGRLPRPIDAMATDFDGCSAKLKADKNTLIATNPSEEVAQLQKEIDLFGDRILLGKMRPKVDIYIGAAKWAAAARGKLAGLTTTKITRKQGALYEEHVTEEYLAIFNEECEHLQAPSFVKVSQRNQRGNTLRKLKVADHGAIRVLSEGEQRAISIADFVTEARMNPHNRGLFFDDPVSSQDSERRERIAVRLVDLAKIKQTIVFTHDLPFLMQLLQISKREDVPLTENHIWRTADSPGLVRSDLPWSAKPVKARIRKLKEDLVKLRKIEKECPCDEYLLEVKKWYGLLRETWERAVEELLFKGVVERFGIGIQTQKLKSVEVTDELKAEVEKGMTRSSTWVHDAAAGLNPVPPDTAQVEKDLGALDAFAVKCASPL
jgi:hypothetical protein